MLSRKSRKSAGRNQAPARIQPSRRAHRRSDIKLFAEELGERRLPSTDIWTGFSVASPRPSWADANNWLVNGSPGVPASGDNLVFPAGALQLSNTDNITSLTVASITFTGTGYTLNSSEQHHQSRRRRAECRQRGAAGTNAINIPLVALNPETYSVATSGQILTDSGTIRLTTNPP